MEIHTTFRKMEPSEAIRKYVETKTQRFKKFLHEPIEVHAVLKVQKIRQLAEVTVTAKNFRFHGVEESPDMYASIDKVADKIGRQLKKHKEKIKAHKSVPSLYEVTAILARTQEVPSE
jgi:putative sigma-54 modulation protein